MEKTVIFQALSAVKFTNVYLLRHRCFLSRQSLEGLTLESNMFQLCQRFMLQKLESDYV